MGVGGGRGIKTRSVFPAAFPRRRFAYFADAGKVGRPQAKSPCTQFFALTRRADEDIGPYEGERQQVVRGGRTLCTPTKNRTCAADDHGPSPQPFPDERGGEAKLRRKFFAQLSFKKAGETAHIPPPQFPLTKAFYMCSMVLRILHL